jgi:hypothetical protein
MSPKLATNLALHLWSYRALALGLSVLAFVAVALIAALGSSASARTAAAFAGPALGLPWALVCVTSWFHPENGTLAPSARFMRRLPRWLQVFARWYGVVVLALFVLFCVIAWPAFAFSDLWLMAQ